MSIRNFDYLFKPRSIALLGASKKPGSVGAVLARNLFNSGFEGPIMPVNPKHEAIEGVLAYPDARSLPRVPDLVVIATPPATVPAQIAAFAERGTKAAIVITAGLSQQDESGKPLSQVMLDATRPYTMRVVGPNCLGLMVPGIGLNASFAHLHPKKGMLAFVAQSGAIVTSVLDWGTSRGIGFSHFVSLGDMSDVDFGDMLDYLANEGQVRAILLYVEAVTHARKFMSAARAASRLKPVIVVKGGRHAAAAAAAASHTGALAGLDAAYDAAFRRAGMLRVYHIGELFYAVETLAVGRAVQGDRLAILTNGGGMGVMATDALLDYGGRLAVLSDETIAELNAVLPETWSKGNPVDIIGDASAERYRKALTILLKNKQTDAILVLYCPTAITSGTEVAKAVIETVAGTKASVLTNWVGDGTASMARRMFFEHRIPTYDTPDRAVRAFMHMVDYRRNQEMLTETPPSVPEEFKPDTAAARAQIDRALENDREWLTEPEAKGVLTAYGIPVVPTYIAADPEEAAKTAAKLAAPVALKILSHDITHKSDVGGVALDIRHPEAVRDAAQAMLRRVHDQHPDAQVDGFTVQPMVNWPNAFELIIGVVDDAQFGPLILFGHGGTAVEIISDTTLALPPLNMHLAHEAMARTRIYNQLRGFRGRRPVALNDVALTLIKVSQLAIDFAELIELDINPLLVTEFGVIALDARIRVRQTDQSAAKRLAIRPYPKDLEEIMHLPDGRDLLLRPVLPEDEPAFDKLFSRMSPEDIRMRFFSSTQAWTRELAARLTQIDYDREMALVLAEPGIAGESKIYGAVHLTNLPGGEQAEYSIMLSSDMVGLGLGPLLVRRIIDYSRGRGVKEIIGLVLRENTAMLKVCDRFKFSRKPSPEDDSLIEVHLEL